MRLTKITRFIFNDSIEFKEVLLKIPEKYHLKLISNKPFGISNINAYLIVLCDWIEEKSEKDIYKKLDELTNDKNLKSILETKRHKSESEGVNE